MIRLRAKFPYIMVLIVEEAGPCAAVNEAEAPEIIKMDYYLSHTLRSEGNKLTIFFKLLRDGLAQLEILSH